jgi:ketosteroid isomerase-like protein
MPPAVALGLAGPIVAAVRDDELEAVLASYEALNRGDIDGTVAVLAPDAEWHESAALPDAGVFRGREAVRSFLVQFLESWQELHQEVEEVVVEGDRAALMIHLRARGRGSGAEVDARYAHVWTVRDATGVRVDAYEDRDAALRAIRP